MDKQSNDLERLIFWTAVAGWIQYHSPKTALFLARAGLVFCVIILIPCFAFMFCLFYSFFKG